MADDTTTESAPMALTAKARYENLKTQRQPVLDRAIECAALTIPFLQPHLGHNEAETLSTPFQGLGARIVRTLAAKLLLALFPPGSSFFRLTMDDFVMQQLAMKSQQAGQAVDDAVAEFETALGKVERAVCNRMEQNGSRSPLEEALKHLINSGNGLLEVTEQRGKLKFYRLDRYVVKRDKEGDVLEILVEELLEKDSLPAEVAAVYAKEQENQSDTQAQEKTIGLYTWIQRKDNRWTIKQEVCGVTVPQSEGTYPLEKTPWLVLRGISVSGEDYGRGYIEEYLGDLQSLESLTQNIVQMSGIASRALIFVKPGGITNPDDVSHAPNGEVVDGDANDVTAFRVDKQADLAIAQGTADKITQRLMEAFLLLQPRDAERVTAEEIRLIAQELEAGLGGLYALLGEELQRPLVSRLMAMMEKAKELPTLPKDAVSPSIVTGLEALGRGSDLQKLDLFIQGAEQLFGAAVVATWINPGVYFKRRAAMLGITVDGLVRSDADVQAAQAAQNQAELTKHISGHVMTAAMQQGDAPAPQQ